MLVGLVDDLRLASPDRVIESTFKIDRPISCDSQRLGQMLSNLVGNALTHGASNKPVIVHGETLNKSFESLGFQRQPSGP